MSDAEIGIIGAGVVGLACAAALSRSGRRVLVIERNASAGRETSSRNSGVIHAGLYYPPGSLKARTCVAGNRLVYERCRRFGVPHLRCGKLVVAVEPSDREIIEQIRARGAACGAEGLEIVNGKRLRELEPEVSAVAALWSPETGIVDAHALVMSYQAEARQYGAQLSFHTRLAAMGRENGAWRIDTVNTQGESFSARVQVVVNAAGLASDAIAALAGLDVKALGYQLHFCKGDYFSLAPALRRITRHLVYPTPEAAGLGTHITFDLGGKYLAGPDAEYVSEPIYTINPEKAAIFAQALRRYLSRVRAEHLSPDFAGVRPKLQGPGEPFRDFVIEEASAYGAPGLVNLIGIESPGLTASEAIAQQVERMLSDLGL